MQALNAFAVPLAETGLRDRLTLRAQIGFRRIGAVARFAGLHLPRFSILSALFLGSTGIYGVTLGNRGTALIDALAEPLGLSIAQVDVTGDTETSEIDVLQALWMTGSQTLPSLDLDAARSAIEAMPWIGSAAISKIYPDRVKIELVEKKPFALSQHGQDLAIVDRAGREIVPFAATRFTDLPFVVGAGAAASAADFVDRMELLPELKKRVRAYIRVGDRRWDIRLENGVTIRLPEGEPIEAAAEVMRLDREYRLLSRDIEAVDMRLEDRVVIRLTPAAKKRRDEAVKARAKILRQAEKEKPA